MSDKKSFRFIWNEPRFMNPRRVDLLDQHGRREGSLVQEYHPDGRPGLFDGLWESDFHIANIADNGVSHKRSLFEWALILKVSSYSID